MHTPVGVLFDIDGLGPAISYGTLCWRILMKHLEPTEMRGVVFYQGDVEKPASKRPYCYCIAIDEEAALTGGRGARHFVERLSAASDAGLFPPDRRFIQGNITESLLGSGRVDIDGRFRMSSNLGDLGDLRLAAAARELGWTVLPDVDLVAVFAATYLAKTGGDGLPFMDDTRQLCEGMLRAIGESATLAALQAAGMPPERLKAASERLKQQVWATPPPLSEQMTSASRAKWWGFWR